MPPLPAHLRSAISGGSWLPGADIVFYFFAQVAAAAAAAAAAAQVPPTVRDGVQWHRLVAIVVATVAAGRTAAGSLPRKGGPSGLHRW